MRGWAATAAGALFVGWLVALSPLAGTAAATPEESKVYLDKATTAFALNRYAVAAENFEKAFELAPDPALLYNAAQAYRLAGNKQRALELYQSYLRMYGNEKREEIQKHVDDLTKAIEHDKEVATSPPTTTEPTKGSATAQPSTEVAAIATAPPPKTEATAPVLVSHPDDRAAERPLTRTPWFWAAVGGGVVAVALVVLLLASGDDPASASLGQVQGN